ncbi:MAG: hypothetical protein ACREQJ_14185, partial [Candidatus Binatia bacterium]
PDGDVARVVDLALRAGRSAARRLAYEEAAFFFESALAALSMAGAGSEARRGELLLLLGEAQKNCGNATRARETYLEAAEVARRKGAPDDLGRAALGLGSLSLAGEWWSDGTPDPPRTALFEEAYAALGANPAMRAKVASRLALDHYWTQNSERAELLSHEAVEIARSVSDSSELATILAGRAVVMLGPDRPAEREALIADGLALAERSGNSEALVELKTLELIGHLERRDRTAVDRAIEEYHALAGELRGAHHAWYGQVIQVTRAIMDGHIEEAERRANETLALGKRSEDRNAVLFYGAQIVTLRTHQGRGAEFETALRGFVSKYPSLVVWRCALAFLLAEAGRKDEARRHFEDLARDDFAHVPRDA